MGPTVDGNTQDIRGGIETAGSPAVLSAVEAIVSARTCGHPSQDHLMISGTELRSMLAAGRRPSEHFSRPEVIDILVDYYSDGQS